MRFVIMALLGATSALKLEEDLNEYVHPTAAEIFDDCQRLNTADDKSLTREEAQQCYAKFNIKDFDKKWPAAGPKTMTRAQFGGLS
jgi:hypothetical protein